MTFLNEYLDMDDLMDWFVAAKFKPGGIIIRLSGNVVFFHNIL